MLSFFAALFITLQAQVEVADSILEQRHEVNIRFELPAFLSLEQLTQIMSIARINNDTVDAFLNRAQWQNFRQLRIPCRIVLTPKKYHYTRSSRSWTYPTESEYRQIMQQFQTQYPEICHLYEAGRSIKNRPLLFVRINTDTSISKPSVMLTSSIHGNETGGMMLMLRLADYLLSQREINTLVKTLTDSLDIWINPLANPDGLYFDTTDIYQAIRFNANGVDLNRNFPDPVKGPHPDNNDYQPETKAMMQLLKHYRFVMSANFHSGEEVVNYPWDCQPMLHPDDTWFRTLAKTYADSAIRYGTNGYFQTYIGNSPIAGITNGYAWYPVYGGRQDYVTCFLHGREVTIELDKDFITPESDLEQLWQSNYRSLLAWLSFALQGVKGVVTDQITGKPIASTVAIADHDDAKSVVISDSTTGIFYRLLLPGSYTFKIYATGYDTCTIGPIAVYSNQYTYLQANLVPKDKINNEIVVPQIFPNPVGNRIFLRSMQTKNWRYALLDNGGRILQQNTWPQNSGLDVSTLLPGIYFLYLTEGKNTQRLRFIKLP
jgi:hypothetical protein